MLRHCRELNFSKYKYSISTIDIFLGEILKKLIFLILWLLFAPPSFANELTLISAIQEETDGYQTGVSLMNEIGKKIGVDFVIRSFPAKRAMFLLQENDERFAGSMVQLNGLEKKIPHLIKVTEPFVQESIVAVSKSKIPIRGWNSLVNYKLCHQRGIIIIEQNLIGFNLKSIALNEINQALYFVTNDRAEIFISPYRLIVNALQSPKHKDSELRILIPPVAVYDFHTYFFKRYADVAIQFNMILKAMKQDGEYEKIVQPIQ